MHSPRIVLAFNGHPASCAAVRWLADTRAASVVALIVDVGQGDDPEETQARALACGAARAHVVDRCDEFVRRGIVPAATAGELPDEPALRQLAYPVIAAALVEVTAIESADAVAHASASDALDAAIHAVDPMRPKRHSVLAPVREWREQGVDPASYVKMHRLSSGAVHPDRHLLMRRRPSSAADATGPATVTIAFESGIPAAVNGVAMELSELIESLSLIGGQYRVEASTNAPALALLRSAYRHSGGHGSVTLQLQPGSLVVSGFSRTDPALVIHA